MEEPAEFASLLLALTRDSQHLALSAGPANHDHHRHDHHRHDGEGVPNNELPPMPSRVPGLVFAGGHDQQDQQQQQQQQHQEHHQHHQQRPAAALQPAPHTPSLLVSWSCMKRLAPPMPRPCPAKRARTSAFVGAPSLVPSTPPAISLRCSSSSLLGSLRLGASPSPMPGLVPEHGQPVASSAPPSVVPLPQSLPLPQAPPPLPSPQASPPAPHQASPSPSPPPPPRTRVKASRKAARASPVQQRRRRVHQNGFLEDATAPVLQVLQHCTLLTLDQLCSFAHISDRRAYDVLSVLQSLGLVAKMPRPVWFSSPIPPPPLAHHPAHHRRHDHHDEQGHGQDQQQQRASSATGWRRSAGHVYVFVPNKHLLPSGGEPVVAGAPVVLRRDGEGEDVDCMAVGALREAEAVASRELQGMKAALDGLNAASSPPSPAHLLSAFSALEARLRDTCPALALEWLEE